MVGLLIIVLVLDIFILVVDMNLIENCMISGVMVVVDIFLFYELWLIIILGVLVVFIVVVMVVGNVFVLLLFVLERIIC